MAEEKKQNEELSDDELEQVVGGRAGNAGKPIKGSRITSPFPNDDIRNTGGKPTWSGEPTTNQNPNRAK